MIRVLTLITALLLTQLAYGEETVKDEKAKKAHPGLMDPAKANETAPEKFDVEFTTTKGDFTLTVQRDWSPNGADRFYNMVRIGYFEEIAFFRAIEGFMVQFGIHGDPKVNEKWFDATIKDDKKKGISNEPGFITFAKTGQPDSRSTQFFLSLGSNGFLDSQGFTPFGKVTKGMEVVKKINTEYGENPRNENVQGDFKAMGNEYIKKRFPKIDFIKSVKLIDAEELEKRKKESALQ